MKGVFLYNRSRSVSFEVGLFTDSMHTNSVMNNLNSGILSSLLCINKMFVKHRAPGDNKVHIRQTNSVSYILTPTNPETSDVIEVSLWVTHRRPYSPILVTVPLPKLLNDLYILKVSGQHYGQTYRQPDVSPKYSRYPLTWLGHTLFLI